MELIVCCSPTKKVCTRYIRCKMLLVHNLKLRVAKSEVYNLSPLDLDNSITIVSLMRFIVLWIA